MSSMCLITDGNRLGKPRFLIDSDPKIRMGPGEKAIFQ